VLACTDHGNLGKFEETLKLDYKGKLEFEEIVREWQDELFQAEDIKIYCVKRIH
jgi:hypothetical protein